LPTVIPDLLQRAEDIEILGSRSEALFLLFQAVFPAGREHWRPVLEALRQASAPLINWRQRRNLLDAALIVFGEDEQLALEMISGVNDPKLKKKFEKVSVTSEARGPRPFFWTTGG